MPDDEQVLRKRRAAAEHAVSMANAADDAVVRLEAKVAKAREDLGRARDGLAEAQQAAKEARREADARSGDLGEVEPGPATSAQAQAAHGGVAASGKRADR